MKENCIKRKKDMNENKIKDTIDTFAKSRPQN